MLRCALYAAFILSAIACAGYPSGPPDPGLGPDRITILSVDASVVSSEHGDSDVLLTFHIRNDAKHRADRVSIHIEAYQGETKIGSSSSHDNPSVRKGHDAFVGVRLENPNTLQELDCIEYRVEALIDGHLGLTNPVGISF